MTPKLDTASTLERIFEMYSKQFGVLLPAALIIYLPVAVLQIVAGGNLVLAIIALLATLVAATWYNGAVVLAVRDLQDGRRDFSVMDVINASVPFILPLIGAGFLYALGVVVGLILLIVPGLILVTIWSLISPVIVIEGTGVVAAFGRSQQIVKGNGWRVFGVLVVMLLITVVAQQVLIAIGSGIAGDIGQGIGFLIAVTITVPLSALTAAVLYYTLLGLKGEGTTPAGEPVADPPFPDPPFPPAGPPGSAPPPGPSPFGH